MRMKTANAIAASLENRGVIPTEQTIRVVAFDGDQILCLTEATLDTWWANLDPTRKAELYEADLEGEIRDESAEAAGDDGAVFQSGVCRYCRCTDARACWPPCCWIDQAHTVCSADDCVLKYETERGIEQPQPGLTLVERTQQQFTANIHACGSTLRMLQADPELASKLVTAAEALLPKERSVDVHA